MGFYPLIRQVHVLAVIASGGLFLIRGLALFSGADWPRARPARRLSQAVDSLLLAAALALVVLGRHYPFVHDWLTVKLLMVVVYIGLGFLAFWKGRSRRVRIGSWLAALLVYVFIFSVARAHHPWGLFRGVAG